MKRSIMPLIHGVLLLTVVTAVSAQTPRFLYDQLLRPAGATFHHVPVGLCEDYPEETTTPQIIRNDMELLKRAGIKLLRISFGWDGIELTKDSYHWGFWDDYVRTAVDEYGITLVPYLCYTPAWNSTGDTTNYWNHTPKDYEQFGKFVTAIVTRYKDKIRSWELWNEPDIPEYWSGNSEDLARLTKIGAKAVKEADPSAIVVLAGLAGRTDFTLRLFRDHHISPFVDVVNLHNYFETWNGDPAEQVVPYIDRVADIVARYGNHQSIWMAEVGYSTYRQPDGTVSDSYHASYSYEHTLAYQAVHLFRTLTLILSTQKVAATTWYEIKDLPPGENVIGDVNNRNLGVAFVDYRPKPAEDALKFFNEFFSKKNRCIDDSTVIVRTVGSQSEVHAFENEDGSVIVVGWLKTKVHGQLTGPNAGDLRDERSEKVTVTLPMALRGKAVRYNELGTASAYKGHVVARASTRLMDIPLAGGTIFIVRIDK